VLLLLLLLLLLLKLLLLGCVKLEDREADLVIGGALFPHKSAGRN
jgi:hypothetical protein